VSMRKKVVKKLLENGCTNIISLMFIRTLPSHSVYMNLIQRNYF